MAAKKCTKRRDARAKLLFCKSKPIDFLPFSLPSLLLKVMLHETIRNDDFKRNRALQHCCDIVWNSYNTVPTLQRCVALKIVVANRLV